MYVSYETDFLLRDRPISVRKSRLPQRRPEPVLGLKEGQHLFFQGDEGSTIYRVTEGVLKLSRVTHKGRQQVVAFAYPGDIIGFPIRGMRNTDCEALTSCAVTELPAKLPTEAHGNPAELAFLAAASLGEIGKMQDHFMTLGRKSSREKVASFLFALMQRAGHHDRTGYHFDLPMSRADIADFLGLRTETVSRAFTELRKAGVIALDTAQSVTVNDPDGLEEIAEAD